MPLLRVIRPGMFSAVQGLGRPGHGPIGVPPSGVADTLSLTIGNRLLGNPDSAAALECTLLGPTVALDHDAWVCLTGARCADARVTGTGGDRPLPWCEPARVYSGELIGLGGMSGGARAYLCISGGFGVPLVLGSRCTLVGASLGGHEGRRLREGDALPVIAPTQRPRALPGDLHRLLRACLNRRTIRVVPSLHADRFPHSAIEQLASAPYTVSDRSDRVGVRLAGHAVPLPEGAGSLASEPTVTGGVQIPGDGRPIVLGVDRPTTGGYALLACVVRVDLPAVAMLRPRETLRFEICSIDGARRMAADRHRTLDALLPPCEASGTCEDGPVA